MYANGEGVPEDDAEAVRWYRLAVGVFGSNAAYDGHFVFTAEFLLRAAIKVWGLCRKVPKSG